jgi:hypothetical protein
MNVRNKINENEIIISVGMLFLLKKDKKNPENIKDKNK